MTFCPVADHTLNDVILTNSPNNCMNVLNFNCGIRDRPFNLKGGGGGGGGFGLCFVQKIVFGQHKS